VLAFDDHIVTMAMVAHDGVVLLCWKQVMSRQHDGDVRIEHMSKELQGITIKNANTKTEAI
jgi:hypothetical protein